tara:strand:- start:1022 stop:1642 length:621 start_codon:yes stop_codon:yes gene_type:complete
MTEEDNIKLQAWLDGELPPHEAARISDWIESDQEARELAEELRSVKVVLQAGEVPFQIEDSREFYWGQIARHIDAVEKSRPVSPVAVEVDSPWMKWCRQWLVPVGGIAAIVAMLSTVGMPGSNSEFTPPAGEAQQPALELPSQPAPSAIEPPAQSAFAENTGNQEGENVKAEDVNVLNLNIPADGNPNLQPGNIERTIPSIENPER